MAFSLGSLLATASSARAGARRGQREQQMQDAEAERQQRMDTFNEYARSRQLAQTDNAQQNAQERLRDQIEAKEIIAARNAELQGKNVEINGYKAREAAAALREKMIRETGQDPLNPTQGYKAEERKSREEVAEGRNAATIQAATVRALSALQAAQARGQQGSGARDDRNVNQLAGQYKLSPPVKTAYSVASSLGDIQTGLAQDNSMGDLQAVYGVIKMFDPASVVKEGEIKLTRSANSLPGKVQLVFQNWTKGRIITPEMRRQIEEIATEQLAQKEELVRPVQARFGAQARSRGVEADSAFIAPSPFEGLTRPASGGGQPKLDPIAEALARRAGKKP